MDYIYKFLGRKEKAHRDVSVLETTVNAGSNADFQTLTNADEASAKLYDDYNFRYKPLVRVNEIRLIKFLSGDSLQCEMIHTTLDTAPPFVALSYTWNLTESEKKADKGNQWQDGKYALPIRGKYLALSENLAQAILHRAPDCFHDGYHFWADAVCINQTDLAERSSHILLMKTLYEKAVRVDVWLGMAADDSDLAIEQLFKWTNSLQEMARARNNDVYGTLASITPKNLEYFGPPGSVEFKAWGALYKLCLRPWWRRVWILQEATGPAPTILCCGQRRLDWHGFMTVKMLSGQLGSFPGLERMKSLDSGNMFYLDVLRSARRAEDRLPLYLLEALQMTRRCECLDDRDRVYAALGMASGLEPGDIVPSYEESSTVAKVYTDVVDHVLNKYPEGHRLDFLGYAVRTWDDGDTVKSVAADERLPTWLPDWRNRIVLTPMAKYIDREDRRGDRAYTASKNTVIEVSRDDRILKVSGVEICEVISVLTGASGEEEIENLWSPSNPEDAYPSGGTRETAFLHTLALDVRRTNFTVHHRGYAIDLNLMKEDAALVDSDQGEERYLMPGVLSIATANRRPFWTDNGYIGMGSAATKPGDKICCLYGGSVLYVLRNKGCLGFEFIGECYVHGLMDGAALELGRESQIFIIE